MFAIARAYLDITLLRRGPQTLPASVALLVLTLIVNAGLNLASTPLLAANVLQVAVAWIVGTVMMLSVLWLLLDATGRRSRYVQTITALLGADNVLLVPELLILALAPAALSAMESGQLTAATLLLVGLTAWRIAVTSNILRQAMSISVLQSLGVILVIFLLYVGALGLLQPWLAVGD